MLVWCFILLYHDAQRVGGVPRKNSSFFGSENWDRNLNTLNDAILHLTPSTFETSSEKTQKTHSVAPFKTDTPRPPAQPAVWSRECAASATETLNLSAAETLNLRKYTRTAEKSTVFALFKMETSKNSLWTYDTGHNTQNHTGHRTQDIGQG